MADKSRRDFLKKTAYVAPAVLTLKATPVLATTGSPHQCRDDDKIGGWSGSWSGSYSR